MVIRTHMLLERSVSSMILEVHLRLLVLIETDIEV